MLTDYVYVGSYYELLILNAPPSVNVENYSLFGK